MNQPRSAPELIRDIDSHFSILKQHMDKPKGPDHFTAFPEFALALNCISQISAEFGASCVGAIQRINDEFQKQSMEIQKQISERLLLTEETDEKGEKRGKHEKRDDVVAVFNFGYSKVVTDLGPHIGTLKSEIPQLRRCFGASTKNNLVCLIISIIFVCIAYKVRPK